MSRKKKDNGHSLAPCRVRWGLEELVGTETVDSVSFVVVVPVEKPPAHCWSPLNQYQVRGVGNITPLKASC